MSEPPADGALVRPSSARNALVVACVALALFAIVLVKSPPASREAARASSAGSSLTSGHNDAAADYEAALKTGKPVFVLFHSLG